MFFIIFPEVKLNLNYTSDSVKKLLNQKRVSPARIFCVMIPVLK